MPRYNPATIEPKWQRYWEEHKTFKTPRLPPEGAEKLYVLDMFPYPSGDGLHVGHPEGQTATDIICRYQRMRGKCVMHPMGWDAFGLPAEQHAIKTGTHPRITTEKNIANFRRQEKMLGFSYDWDRELSTTDVEYLRWTQWIFLLLFDTWYDEEQQKGRPICELPIPGEVRASGEEAVRRYQDEHRLAYQLEAPVNWCPALGTVLANEEVTADGRSDIGNFPVYRRPMRQWMMRITAMAQRLIDDLDGLAWPENVKQLQRNWIGASDGAVVWLPMAAPATGRVEVFTTRPDTLYGATFAVLAPEHPLADSLVADTWPAHAPAGWRAQAASPRAAVAAYREAAAQLSDRQRLAEGGTKSGVFTGGYVINPLTGEQIPVFVADYVLMGYGTGAIMAVPAHDERDLEFARRYGLPVRDVTDPSGQYLEAPGPALAGLDAPAAVGAAVSWLERAGSGRAARRYRLRDWLFSRQRYWGEPFPVVYGDDNEPIGLPEDALPVLLPEMTDFRPEPDAGEDSEPVPPLARATEWANVELDLGDGPRSYRRELNTMPQWAGSCWYYLRYLDPGNDEAFVDPAAERYWLQPGGVDLYVGGVEHAVLHLLYARFWHKVLYDRGLVHTPEPFARLVNQGMIQADAFTDERGIYVPAAEVAGAASGTPSYRGRPVTRRSGKMGKSLKNGISPDQMYQQYGADTLRLYEMAMGPLDADKPWRTDDITGVHRFLQRLWRSMVDEQTGLPRVSDAPLDDTTVRVLHATIASVRQDFAGLRFNTAIARLTELTTTAARVSAAGRALPRSLAEPLVLMVAPLAPHIAEELWARLGHTSSLAYAAFPEADPALARTQSVRLPVQVNGRTRFRVEVPAGAAADEIERIVTTHPDYQQHASGGTVERLVIVPDRIVNIVVR